MEKMLFQDITLLDENLDIKEGMYVRTDEGKITYVGSEKPEGEDDRVYDGSGKLLMEAHMWCLIGFERRAFRNNNGWKNGNEQSKYYCHLL